jgi:hypothetical protein
MTTTERNRMTRTDLHRPSVLDPADYECVGDFDAHAEEGYEYLDPNYADREYSGDHAYTGRCGHCGQSIRYGAIFYHAPTDTLVSVGLRCASTLGLKSISEKEIRAKGEAAARRKKVEEWAAESSDNAAALAYLTQVAEDDAADRDAMGAWNDLYDEIGHKLDWDHKAIRAEMPPQPKPKRRYNEFIADVGHKLLRYGGLSEKQVAAVLKNRDREAEFAAKREAEAAKLADAPALAEGRYEIEGDVVSVKSGENDYGFWMKMLVKMDDGNKVYGTVPSALGSPEKGERVQFTAKVDRSPDDEHFGFFSRPTKATHLNH